MKCKLVPLLLFAAAASTAAVAGDAADPLCAPLRKFVESVEPKQTKSLTFHTVWGGNFKGESRETIYAARCIDNGYAPAKAVCESLLKRSSKEFPSINVKRSLACLSPKTVFGTDLKLRQAEFEIDYGSDDDGSVVTVKFYEDLEMGSTALSISAKRY